MVIYLYLRLSQLFGRTLSYPLSLHKNIFQVKERVKRENPREIKTCQINKKLTIQTGKLQYIIIVLFRD